MPSARNPLPLANGFPWGALASAGYEPDGARDRCTRVSDLGELADMVRTARKQKGWSQEDLAERADVTLGVVSTLERMKARPQLANRRRILRALDLAEPEASTGDDETARVWPRDVSIFVDVMGLALTSIPEAERAPVIHHLTREAMHILEKRGLGDDS